MTDPNVLYEFTCAVCRVSYMTDDCSRACCRKEACRKVWRGGGRRLIDADRAEGQRRNMAELAIVGKGKLTVAKARAIVARTAPPNTHVQRSSQAFRDVVAALGEEEALRRIEECRRARPGGIVKRHNGLAIAVALDPPVVEEPHPLGAAIRCLRSWGNDPLADELAVAWLQHDIDTVEEHRPLTDSEADRIAANMRAGWPDA